jgi:HEAT repeat protein
MVRSLELPLADFLQRSPELLIHELEDSDSNRQAAAAAALTAMGKRAAPALLKYVSTSDNVRSRSAALFVFRRVANDFDVLIRRRLVESPAPEESCRLVAALEQLGLPWIESLNVLLHSASPDVRRQAYSFFQKSTMPKLEKGLTLNDLLQTDHPGVVADALRAAGSLRIDQLISTITWVLKRTFDKPENTILVQREACYALGRIGEAHVLPLLKTIAFPSLTQKVVGGREPEVRSAALWAIGRIPGVEADELLDRGNLDKDPLVRAVAKVAIDTRNSVTTDPDLMAQMELL